MDSFSLSKKQIKKIKEKIFELKGIKAKECHLNSQDFEDLFDLDSEGANLLLQSFDTDENGTVEWTELIGGIVILSSDPFSKKAQFLFETWDMDKNSVLDRNEIRQMLTSVITIAATIQCCNKLEFVTKKLGKNFSKHSFQDRKNVRRGISLSTDDLNTAVNEFFNGVDTDQNGEISFEEFLEYCKSDPESIKVFQNKISELACFDQKKSTNCSIM
ncbi:calcium binding protein [Anaeramoeba flamelloides]|uniref:Calcium binding protein n=1 Tax=Anaeramoeba flamelloides TaxID=1746091 RepID=A0ABQ8YRB4_9EUKA|nr:calcium binding protein [Anaeramoeba flamelloides]